MSPSSLPVNYKQCFYHIALEWHKRKHPRSRWNEGVVLRYIFGLGVFDARFGNIDFERVVGQGIGIEHADRLICIGL